MCKLRCRRTLLKYSINFFCGGVFGGSIVGRVGGMIAMVPQIPSNIPEFENEMCSPPFAAFKPVEGEVVLLLNARHPFTGQE